jgi:2-methylcitrate dehydratase PrpD
VLAAGTAGHVLDFDDTYLPGLAHLSAPTAPAALVLGAELGESVGAVLEAYAEGFEAMGALAAASHPALYEGGWHPTAVCGPVGSATAAARLLGLGREGTRTAVRLSLLGAGGLRAAFGTHGKSLQVGMAAAGGVRAARLAAAGAELPVDVARGPAGFEEAFGGRFAEPAAPPAIERNWIKAWPCCLQTHGAIEAADRARKAGVAAGGSVEVAVHPVSLKAAPVADPADSLQAKFSIPYLAAFTLLHGPPGVDSFGDVDPQARGLAREGVRVRVDGALLESEALLDAEGGGFRVEAALGSPQRPMDDEALATKVRALAGGRVDGALDDLDRPAADLLAALGPRAQPEPAVAVNRTAANRTAGQTTPVANRRP